MKHLRGLGRSFAATGLALTLGLAARAPLGDDPFPTAEPLAVDVDPAGLEALSRLVAELVEKDEVVGAELLVVKRGHTVLHPAFGHADRESGAALEPGSLYCVRSMTKPVVGTAIVHRLTDDAGVPVLVVRARAFEARPFTLRVEEESGRLCEDDQMVVVPGAGRMGSQTRHDDWRDAGGRRARGRFRRPLASVRA